MLGGIAIRRSELVALLALVCGCAKTATPAAVGQAPASTPSVAGVTAAAPRPEVVASTNTEASLKELFATTEEMAASPAVDTIVKGRVTAAEPVYLDHVAFTRLTVKVSKSYKGDPAKDIVVYEDGGLVPLRAVLPELEGKSDVPTFTPEQIANGVIDMRMMGADHSAPGEQLLLFLMKNPNADMGDSYMVVSSVYGRFKSNGAGEWERPALKSTEESGSGTKSDLVARFESKKSDAAMEAALGKAN